MEKLFLTSLVLLALFLVYFLAGGVLAATGTIDSVYKYAWGNKAGWLNFKATNGNISITDSALTGYIWNEVYGWINLAPTGSGVTNTTSGVFSGSAWGQNAGWINFSGVSINCSGKFTGSATGDTVGTITFDCSNCNVTTNWTPSTGCGGGGGGPPPPPPPPPVSHNECNVQKQCVSVSGAGINQCATNNDCVTPVHSECNAQEQCVSVSGLGIDQCEANIDCAPTHNECNAQKQCVVEPGIGADRCQKNEDCDISLPPVIPPVIPPELPPVIPPELPPAVSPFPSGGAGIIETLVKATKAVTQIVKKQIPETLQAPVEAVKVVAQEVKKIIETPQGSAVTKTISTVGAVVATAQIAAAIIFSPLELFLFFVRIFGVFLTVLGIKKRIRHWGVVYDSVTKQPLDPAYVVLKDPQGKIISSAITDLDGRYGFLAFSGDCQISVSKTNYIFPSQKLAGRKNDELYNDLYFGENIGMEQSGETIIKNIPMDPLRFDWNEFAKRDKKLMNFYSRMDVVLRQIFDLFFIVGFVVAIVAYFAAPYPYNLIILVTYLALLLLRTIGIKPKAYGRIFDGSNGNPLSFALLRVMMPDLNVEIAHKVADKYGRYYCLVPKGKYYVKIEKKNDDGSYSLIYSSPVIDVSKKGIIKKSFRI